MGESLFWEKAETWQEMLTRHPESLMDPLHIGIIVIQQAARYLNKISTSVNYNHSYLCSISRLERIKHRTVIQTDIPHFKRLIKGPVCNI